jgi:hypothetical protein
MVDINKKISDKIQQNLSNPQPKSSGTAIDFNKQMSNKIQAKIGSSGQTSPADSIQTKVKGDKDKLSKWQWISKQIMKPVGAISA